MKRYPRTILGPFTIDCYGNRLNYHIIRYLYSYLASSFLEFEFVQDSFWVVVEL